MKKYRVRHLRSKSKKVKFSEKLIIQPKQWTSDLQCMRVLSMNAQCLTENNDHLHVKFSTSYRVAMFHSCKNVNKHLEPDFILISLACCVKRQFIMRSVYPLNCVWCFNDDQGFDLLLNRIHFCPQNNKIYNFSHLLTFMISSRTYHRYYYACMRSYAQRSEKLS